jgi:glutathione S-transferase
VATPGAGGKYSTRRSEFLSSFPLGTIPSIEDIDDGNNGDSTHMKVCLSEAPAILAYLSAKNNWEDIYPTDISSRAKVDEYCTGTIPTCDP